MVKKGTRSPREQPARSLRARLARYAARNAHGHSTCDAHGHATCDPHGHPACDPHGDPASDRVRSPTKGTRRVTRRATRTVTPRATRTVTPRGSRTVTGGSCVAPAGPQLRAIIIRCGAADTACVMAAAGGRLARSASWARSIIGSDQYYPYAYISAPENYCEGLTEDGCELMWQDVETIEGDVVPQCVAYCPWQ